MSYGCRNIFHEKAGAIRLPGEAGGSFGPRLGLGVSRTTRQEEKRASPFQVTRYTVKIPARLSAFACSIGLVLLLASCGGSSSSNPSNPANPLEVVSTSPAGNSTNVPSDNSINLAFSAEIDPMTVNQSTVGLTSAGRDISFTVSASGNTVTLNPSAQFCLHSTYTATATTGIKDLDGNRLGSTFSLSFITQDGAWGGPERIDGSSGTVESPKIVVNGSGDAVAVWAERVGLASNQRIWARRYVHGSGWEPAQRIELDDTSDSSVPQIEVGIDADGNAIAVWTQWSGTTNIWANRYVAGTGWQTAELLETDTLRVLNPRLSMSPTGSALVTWLRRDVAQPDNSVI